MLFCYYYYCYAREILGTLTEGSSQLEHFPSMGDRHEAPTLGSAEIDIDVDEVFCSERKGDEIDADEPEAAAYLQQMGFIVYDDPTSEEEEDTDPMDIGDTACATIHENEHEEYSASEEEETDPMDIGHTTYATVHEQDEYSASEEEETDPFESTEFAAPVLDPIKADKPTTTSGTSITI